MEIHDILTEIPMAEWPQLRELYRQDWPKNMLGCLLVDTLIQWTTQRKGPTEGVNIYTLNADWSDGTFLCVHRHHLYLYTLDQSNDRLTRAAKLLDWSPGYLITAVLPQHHSSVDSVVDTFGLSLDFDQWLPFYHMSWQDAIKVEINCPPDITLGPLHKEHAAKIDEMWPNRYVGSLGLIQQLIELSPNVGAFDGNGELMAWCLRLTCGPHSMLQVDEKYRQRGLGSLVCRKMTRILGEMGQDSSATIFDHNTASKRTFERIGFKVIGRIFYLQTRPIVNQNAPLQDY